MGWSAERTDGRGGYSESTNNGTVKVTEGGQTKYLTEYTYSDGTRVRTDGPGGNVVETVKDGVVRDANQNTIAREDGNTRSKT